MTATNNQKTSQITHLTSNIPVPRMLDLVLNPQNRKTYDLTSFCFGSVARPRRCDGPKCNSALFEVSEFHWDIILEVFFCNSCLQDETNNKDIPLRSLSDENLGVIRIPSYENLTIKAHDLWEKIYSKDRKPSMYKAKDKTLVTSITHDCSNTKFLTPWYKQEWEKVISKLFDRIDGKVIPGGVFIA